MSFLEAFKAVVLDIIDNSTFELKEKANKKYFVLTSQKYHVNYELYLGEPKHSEIGIITYSRNISSLEEIIYLELKTGDKFTILFNKLPNSSKLDFDKLTYVGKSIKLEYS